MSEVKKQMSKLTSIQSFELMGYIKEHYTASGLFDKEFAEKFSAERFPVTTANVQGARTQLGIESAFLKRSSAASTAAEEVLDKLAKIEDKLDRLLRYFSEVARRDL